MNAEDSSIAPERQGILELMDSFIEHIQNIRKLLLGVSLSAVILAPLAMVLSAYLLLHPSFFAILEVNDEFGLVLIVLLIAVIIISGVWLPSGIKQYRSMSRWNARYDEYVREKDDIDRKIASNFGLDQE